MGRKLLWLVATFLMVATVTIVSCGPKTAPTPTRTTGPTPVTPAAPTPAIPAPGQPAPTVAPENMINVTLKKLDGSAIKKQVEKPKYGGTLNLRGTADPVWDLRLVSASGIEAAMDDLLHGDWSRGTAGTGEISWQIYEYFSMNHFMPALAESWEMPDDGTIIYHLRRGVRWALDEREASKLVGGRELTADDVVFSLKWWFFSEPKSTLRGYFSGAEKADIRAMDKYTVVVKAPKQDLAQFLGFMSDMLFIFPPEVIQKYGTFTSWDKVVGTGAFMIKDFVSSSVTTWVKNPNYWGYDPVLGKNYPLPYVDSMKSFIISDESTATAAIRTGRLDGTLALDKEKGEELRRTAPNLKVKIINFGTGSNRIAMQMNDTKAPWQDIRVRRALMLAINHQEIVDTYYGGGADLQAFPLPGAPELYAMGWAIPLKELPKETQELFEYHPDKAKQLLAEAGYPNGFKTSLMLSASAPEWLDLGSILKEYWAKVGVEITLDIKDTAVFAGLSRGGFPAMIPASRWGTATIYSKFDRPPSTNNEGQVADPNIERLRQEMFNVQWDMKKRTPIMRELYEYTMSQMWYLALPSKWTYKFYQPWLKNYDAEASVGYQGGGWPYVWIDRDLKKKLGY